MWHAETALLLLHFDKETLVVDALHGEKQLLPSAGKVTLDGKTVFAAAVPSAVDFEEAVETVVVDVFLSKPEVCEVEG